jgi:hypothetical protein
MTAMAQVTAAGVALALQISSDAAGFKLNNESLQPEGAQPSNLINLRAHAAATNHHYHTKVHTKVFGPEATLLHEVKRAYAQLPAEARLGRLSELEFPWYLRSIEQRIQEQRSGMFQHPHASIEARSEAFGELRDLHHSVVDMQAALPAFKTLRSQAETLRGPWVEQVQLLSAACEACLKQGDGTGLRAKTVELSAACESVTRAQQGMKTLAVAGPMLAISAAFLLAGLQRSRLATIIDRICESDSSDQALFKEQLRETSTASLLLRVHEVLGYLSYGTNISAQEAAGELRHLRRVCILGIGSTAASVVGLGMLSGSASLQTASITLGMGITALGGWLLDRCRSAEQHGHARARAFAAWCDTPPPAQM